jgi:hypothetical protein
MLFERSTMTMAQNLKTLISKPFAMTWVSSTSFRVSIRPPKWRGGKEKQNLVSDGPDDARRA